MLATTGVMLSIIGVLSQGSRFFWSFALICSSSGTASPAGTQPVVTTIQESARCPKPRTSYDSPSQRGTRQSKAGLCPAVQGRQPPGVQMTGKSRRGKTATLVRARTSIVGNTNTQNAATVRMAAVKSTELLAPLSLTPSVDGSSSVH